MAEETIVYVCKSCGRAIRTETKPKCCYFDRNESIENIGDDDSKRMGLFSSDKNELISGSISFPCDVEFPGDIRYDPFTGEKIELQNESNYTMHDFQNNVMDNLLRKE